MKIRRILIALVVVVAVVGAACTSSSDTPELTPTTTSFEFPDLEFGRAVIPASVPSSWPTPEQAVIGTTMLDGTRRLTEIVVTYPSPVVDVADYYMTNLPVLGYEVSSAEGGDGAFEIEFSGDGVSGTIVLTTGGTGLTAGTIRMLHS